MTTLAYREVVAAKRALPVMTTHTTKRTLRRVMIERPRRRHFTRPHAMTLIATQPLISIVLRVTETNSEGAGRLARAHVTTELMPHATRRDISIAGFRLRPMTLKTGGVCIEANGNRERHATASRSMTARTRASIVTRMIEFHVEAA